MMLAAIIQVGGVSANARIRGISETGALVEAATLPEAGTALTLSRSGLDAAAQVVWARRRRCRLRFDRPVIVADWVDQTPLARPGSPAQRRVDAIQAEIRSGGAPNQAAPAKPAPGEALDARLPLRLAEEIAYVQGLIESIGDELIVEPLIVHRHAGALQKFDAANQILGHISAILSADDRVGAAERVGMQDLRSRLLRP